MRWHGFERYNGITQRCLHIDYQQKDSNINMELTPKLKVSKDFSFCFISGCQLLGCLGMIFCGEAFSCGSLDEGNKLVVSHPIFVFLG